jgi:hypothetical protein
MLGPNVCSTNVLKTLNDTLGNGWVCGAAETKGTEARVIHSIVNDEKAVAVRVRHIKRGNKVHIMVKPRELRDTTDL